jgi:DNA polymerase-3 subunit gamma/tau
MDFKRLSVIDTVKKLQFIVDSEEINVDKGVLETIARHSGGYLRDAESLLGQVISLSSTKEISAEQANLILPQSNILQVVKYLDHIANNETAKAIRLINNLVDSGADLKTFLVDVLQILRKIIMEKINPGLSQSLGLDFGENIEKEVLTLSTKLDIEKLAWYIDSYIKISDSLKSAQIKQLPLELVTIKLSKSKRVQSPNNYNKEENFNNFIQEKKETKNTVNQQKTDNYNFKEIGLNKEKGDIKEDNQVEVFGSSQAEKINISIEDIQAKWKEFILKIKSENHSLTFILQNCWPSDIKEGIIDLKCKYKFHQERLKDANIQDIIIKNLKSFFKCNLKYITNIDSDLEIPGSRNKKEVKFKAESTKNIQSKKIKEKKAQVNNEQKGTINNILNAFGGEIIN